MGISEVWDSLDAIKGDIISISGVTEAVANSFNILGTERTSSALCGISKNLDSTAKEVGALVDELILLQKSQETANELQKKGRTE